MIKAAGIMCLTTDQKVLLLKRGGGGDHPGEWCFPGGQIEDGETALEAAIRETEEEAGYTVKAADLALHTRSVQNAEVAAASTAETLGAAGEGALPSFPAAPVEGLPPTDAIVVPGVEVDFTTYAHRLVEPFVPVLNDEHSGWAWASVDAPPEPLHPGCRVALRRLTWNELDVARAMSRGELTSPQLYDNVALFAIRITGTGVAYRSTLKEFVWRDPSIYMNQDFLDRCNGLQVIWEHPEGATLDSEEFGDRTVGSVFVPYLKPEADEVWAICKVYDAAAVAWMSDPKKDASTSPTVVFKEAGGGQKLTMEDGSVILFEGTPRLLDHIAICPLGVWDKGKDPAGVDRSGVFADAAPAPMIFDLAKLRAADLALTTLSLRFSNVLSR